MNVLKIVVFILATISLLLNMLYLGKPQPIQEAFVLSNIAGALAFLIAYRETKDWFWLVSALSFGLMIFSDLYFYPNWKLVWPHESGGMNIWAGISQATLAIGLFFYFNKLKYRWLLPIIFVPMFFTNFGFGGIGELTRGSAIAQITGAFWSITLCSLLMYYGQVQKSIGYTLGAGLRLLSLLIAVWYFFAVAHDIRPLTLAWTDKTHSISRDIMAIGALIVVRKKK